MATKLLKALLLGLSFARSAETVRKAIRVAVARIAIALLAVLTLVTGLGFLLASAYTATAAWIGPTYASLAVGGVLVAKAWFWMALSRRMGTARAS